MLSWLVSFLDETIIRHLDCTCVVFNPQFQLTNIPPTSCCGNTTLGPTNPDGIGFLVCNFEICDPNENKLNSRHHTFTDGDATRLLRSIGIARPSFTLKNVRCDGSIHTTGPHLALIASSSTSRWPNYVIFNVTPTHLGPLMVHGPPHHSAMACEVSSVHQCLGCCPLLHGFRC